MHAKREWLLKLRYVRLDKKRFFKFRKRKMEQFHSCQVRKELSFWRLQSRRLSKLEPNLKSEWDGWKRWKLLHCILRLLATEPASFTEESNASRFWKSDIKQTATITMSSKKNAAKYMSETSCWHRPTFLFVVPDLHFTNCKYDSNSFQTCIDIDCKK